MKEVECHIQLIRYGVKSKNGKFKIHSLKFGRRQKQIQEIFVNK